MHTNSYIVYFAGKINGAITCKGGSINVSDVSRISIAVLTCNDRHVRDAFFGQGLDGTLSLIVNGSESFTKYQGMSREESP